MSMKTKVMKGLLMSLMLLFLPSLSFINISSAPSTLTYRVEPGINTGHVGMTINVKVNVYDAVDLYGWQVRMDFDSNVLQAVGIIIGGFLGDQPEGTTPGSRIAASFVTVGETTNGAYPGVYGDGWLCTIKFLVKAETADVLDIDNAFTFALNRFLSDILPHNKENGDFVAPWAEDINADGGVDIFDLASVAYDLGTYAIQQHDPSSNSGSWSNGAGAYTSNDNWASSGTKNAEHVWGGYGFSATGWTGVDKVEVGLERHAGAAENDGVTIYISNDGGSTWSGTSVYVLIVELTDTFTWYDLTSAYSWTGSMAESIAVKLKYTQSGGSGPTLYVDWLPVKVTPSPAPMNPFTDVSGDGQVSVLDLTLVAMMFGYYLE